LKLTDLADGGCEYDHFVNLSHLLEEIFNSGSLDHIDVVPLKIDLNWYHKVGV
jgi:hypothetical protein